MFGAFYDEKIGLVGIFGHVAGLQNVGQPVCVHWSMNIARKQGKVIVMFLFCTDILSAGAWPTLVTE